MAVKGISLGLSDSGEAFYQPGYEVKESPFVELGRLLEKYRESEDPELMQKMLKIIESVPDPMKPETWIGLDELNLLKEIWRYNE